MFRLVTDPNADLLIDDQILDKNYQRQGVPNILPNNGETLGQVPQLELVVHTIACAPNPYCDPYYGGMVAAYGQYTPYITNQKSSLT
ncbi:putative nuclear transcription factor Y subunit A [Helianthus annuus]|nr:putative nuclear transcription factor Y subunit A [Helianthus annuus]